MKRIGNLLFGLLLFCSPALAQTPQLMRECVGTAASCIPVSAAAPLPVTAGSGGLGAVTIADGADVAEGARADSAYAGSGSASVVAALKGIYNSVNLSTSGGITAFFLQPVASDNHTTVKNGAGQVYWILAENNSATVNYLRLYNSAAGFNGCNSATGLVSQIQIPASTSVGGINIALPFGIPFSTGISICVTSGYATTDTTSATASAISLTIGYF